MKEKKEAARRSRQLQRHIQISIPRRLFTLVLLVDSPGPQLQTDNFRPDARSPGTCESSRRLLRVFSTMTLQVRPRDMNTLRPPPPKRTHTSHTAKVAASPLITVTLFQTAESHEKASEQSHRLTRALLSVNGSTAPSSHTSAAPAPHAAPPYASSSSNALTYIVIGAPGERAAATSCCILHLIYCRTS